MTTIVVDKNSVNRFSSTTTFHMLLLAALQINTNRPPLNLLLTFLQIINENAIFNSLTCPNLPENAKTFSLVQKYIVENTEFANYLTFLRHVLGRSEGNLSHAVNCEVVA
jgi:hypothetical protein